MSQLRVLTHKVYQDSFIQKDEGVSFYIDINTIVIISSLIVQIIKLIYDCNKSKLSQSVFYSPRTLEKVWLARKIKQLLPDSEKNNSTKIYKNILKNTNTMTQKDIDSLVLEIFSNDGLDKDGSGK